MKRILIALALMVPLALPVAMTGCKAASTTTTPQALAPGYLNPADQGMGQGLVGAHAFYVSIQCSTQGFGFNPIDLSCDQSKLVPKYLPSPAEKTALNNFATALNTAQMVYIGYHAGVNTQAQAQAAVDAVTSQQVTIQSSLTGGK